MLQKALDITDQLQMTLHQCLDATLGKMDILVDFHLNSPFHLTLSQLCKILSG